MKSVLLLAVLGLASVLGNSVDPPSDPYDLRPQAGSSCCNATDKVCCSKLLDELIPEFTRYQDAILAGDVEGSTLFYMSKAVLLLGQAEGLFWVGRDEIHEFFESSYTNFKIVPYLGPLRYSVDCHLDVITVYGLTTYLYSPEYEGRPFRYLYDATITFVRNPDCKGHPHEHKWLISAQHYVSVHPF